MGLWLAKVSSTMHNCSVYLKFRLVVIEAFALKPGWVWCMYSFCIGVRGSFVSWVRVR